jgi:hypothetical protein
MILMEFVLLSIFCLALENNNSKSYFLGEKIKINLENDEEYTLKIQTPLKSYIRKGEGSNIIFQPKEIGNYNVLVKNYNYEKNYNFEVISISEQSQIEKDKKEIEKLDGTSEYLKYLINNKTKIQSSRDLKANQIIQEPAEINKQVKWKKITNGTIHEYTTPAPEIKEQAISKTKKQITISSPEKLHYKNVKAYTNIEEILPLNKKQLIKIYWKQEDKYIDNFQVKDENNNGYIDKIEWQVPHLSEQTFEIIIITKAEHLDKNREFVKEVYEKVKARDNIWQEIRNKEYIRVKFEQPLNSNRDITIYARSSNQSQDNTAEIEVYTENSNQSIAKFENINEEDYYKIYLTNLSEQEDTFDLRSLGDVDYDYIVDPIQNWHFSGFDYRKNHTINGTTDGQQTDYVMHFIIHNGSGTDSGENVYINTYQNDFSDIKFTNSTGQELDYFLEEYNSTDASFWVEIDSIPASPNQKLIYIYYGNSTAQSKSNGTETFIEFEGFEHSSYEFDTGSITLGRNSETSVSGSYSGNASETSGTYRALYKSGSNYDVDDYIFEFQGYWISNLGGNSDFLGGLQIATQASETDGYQTIIDAREARSPQIREDHSWNGREDGNYQISLQNWYFVKFFRENNDLKAFLYEDSISMSQLGSANMVSETTYQSGEFGLFCYACNNIRWDNVRVRKRADPEPLHGIWGQEEEQPPSLTIDILYPKNKSYSFFINELNYTIINESALDSCWWTNNSGKTNHTINCGENITEINSTEGSNTWIVYANDTIGNIGNDEITFVIDTISPQLTIDSPKNRTYPPYKVDFNISGNENLDYCKFTINNWQTNYTMSKYNDTYFNYTNSSMIDGSFTARFWCNDTAGNENKTEQVDFGVRFPQVGLDLIYPNENIIVGHYDFFNVTLNVSCLKTDCGEINITLDPDNWLDDEWEYRKRHYIQGTTDGQQTDYVMHFIIHNGSGTGSGKHIYCEGKCREDFQDIRFTSGDGKTELDYFLEEYNSTDASFWVEIDSIPASPDSTTVYVYYGNEGAGTTSNPEDAFLFFEGFESSHTLNSGSGSITLESGGITGQYQADVNGDSDHAVVYNATSNFSRNDHFFEAYVKYITSDTIPVGIHFCGQNSGDDGYQMIIDDRESGSTPSMRKDTDYGSSVTGNYLVGTGNWVFFRVYADSSNFYGQVYEDAFKDSISGSAQFLDSEYIDGSVGVFAYQDGGGKIDNLRVRKRADPEPLHGIWEQEEGYAPEKSIINTSIGAEPFYTNASTNPLTTSYLNFGESEIITFWVNATFSRGVYEFFAYANITSNLSLNNITKKWNITIDSIGPEINDVNVNKEYTCGTVESVRVNCSAVDSLSNVSLVIIEAIKPTNNLQNYTAQKLSGNTYYSDIVLNELGDWQFRCFANDSFNNLRNADSSDIVTTYSNLPDLKIDLTDIVFSNLNPIENQNIIINATIYNLACGNADNIPIGFYNGDPDINGEQINGNKTKSIPGLSNSTVNVTWNSEIGMNNLFVFADFNNSINEYNESNNKANKTLYIDAWQEFYGNASVNKLIADSQISNLSLWYNETNLQGSIFVTDKEADIDWINLNAIGRNTTQDNTSNDFAEIDSSFNMEDFNDSVSEIFTIDGDNPKATENFTIHKQKIEYVPIINSTDNDNFVTGILWDTSDDSNGEYGGDSEDLVFVAKINKQKQGKYGIYDYEIRIPVRLREYDDTDTNEIYFYYELN